MEDSDKNEDKWNTLTLEKLKISDRLTKIEVILSELKEISEKNSIILYGNGRDGILTRLDRIEQSKKAEKWIFGIFITAVIGLLVKVFFEAFKK